LQVKTWILKKSSVTFPSSPSSTKNPADEGGVFVFRFLGA